MDIFKIELITETETHTMNKLENNFTYRDCCVKLASDGSLSVTSDDTKIKFVKVIFENKYFTDDALVFASSWERGYGDFAWRSVSPDRVLPWYFTASEGDKTYCFGVETQPNALCFWNCSREYITLSIDIRNGSSALALEGRILNACRIVVGTYADDAHSAMHRFCKAMCPNPRIPSRPIYGGNDWYCNYGNNSFDKILKHTENIVSCAPKGEYKPYMVIDDGWEEYYGKPANSGPWICNDKFGDMQKMADAIEELGAIPGIWLRPLTTVEKVPDEHRLRTAGDEVTLDPSSPLVLDMVRNDISTIVGWGYKLIKHDFSTWDIFGNWGKNFPNIKEINFFDKTKTTAEIINNFYNVIRKAAGDDVLIIGCNTMSHLSAGVFDLQRTGDDTSGVEWERTKIMGINTLAFTMHQHGAFYAIDADCVGITTKISWQINKKWLDVLSRSGTPLFVSIEAEAFTDEVKKDVTEAFGRAVENQTVSKALDWKYNTIPKNWLSAYGDDTYEWENE
ncbi:MAG: hypothetical protein IJ454_03860 [Clostridia bacterium]|nr:hypothetical protein [Clostridia bacterium]